MKKSLWLPAVLVAPVVVAGAVAAPAIANAATEHRTGSAPSAASVLASVAGSTDVAYSGRLTQKSDLGLPSLPASSSGSGASSSASGASSVLELLTASHTARVYVDGPDKARVQVLDSLAERDVVVHGKQVWTWDSKAQRAVHLTLPTRSAAAAQSSTSTTTPAALAQRAIAAITPSTRVSRPTSTTVAGQAAWRIVLTPRSASTLVHDVTIAIDKKTGLPLSAAIDAKGQSAPAVSVAYTSIDYGTPRASLFDFTPPTGAKVTTKDFSTRDLGRAHARGSGRPHGGSGAAASAAPATTGSGWGTIATLPAGTFDTTSVGAGGSQLLGQLTKAVHGGRAIQTSLVSVYIADDGRVLAGAVPVADLVAAAE